MEEIKCQQAELRDDICKLQEKLESLSNELEGVQEKYRNDVKIIDDSCKKSVASPRFKRLENTKTTRKFVPYRTPSGFVISGGLI